MSASASEGEAQGDRGGGPEALHLYLLDAPRESELPGVARAADETGGVPDATHGVVSVVG